MKQSQDCVDVHTQPTLQLEELWCDMCGTDERRINDEVEKEAWAEGWAGNSYTAGVY